MIPTSNNFTNANNSQQQNNSQFRITLPSPNANNSATSNPTSNHNINMISNHSLNSLFGILPDTSTTFVHNSNVNNNPSFMQIPSSNNEINLHHMLNQSSTNSLQHMFPIPLNNAVEQKVSPLHTTDKSQSQNHHNSYSNVSFSTSSLASNSNMSSQPFPTQQEKLLHHIQQEQLLKELTPEQLFQLYMVLEKVPSQNQQAHVVINPSQNYTTLNLSNNNNGGIDHMLGNTNHETISRLLLNALQNQHESTSNAISFPSSSTHVNDYSIHLNLSNISPHEIPQQIQQEDIPNASSMNNNQHVSSTASIDDLIAHTITNQSISSSNNNNHILSLMATQGVLTQKQQSVCSSVASSSDSNNILEDELLQVPSSRGIKKSPKQTSANFSIHTIESFKTEQMRIQSLPKRPRGRPRKPGSIPRRRKKPSTSDDQTNKQKIIESTTTPSSSNESSSNSDGNSSDQSTNTAEPNH